MVFFNCNACGEALKKNQVEKHVIRCRQCEVLSCVDCGKDFWGNDYQSHTKCISEEEKYCGLGYVPKVNKGEAKQEQWIEKVQGAIEKAASNHALKSLLIKLKDYPNIPRKQQKFQNFLKNSLRVHNDFLISQVWNTLMTHADQDRNKENSSSNALNQVLKTSDDEHQVSKQESNKLENCVANGNKDEKEDIVEPKKNKRERKEERRNKTNKQEKKDCAEQKEIEEKPVKKGKKRKHRPDNSEEHVSDEIAGTTNGFSGNQPLKKKKKKKYTSDDQPEEDANGDVYSEVKEHDQLMCEEPEKKMKKEKFNWKKTITKVLEEKGEISLKKLRKKVLNEFSASGSSNYSEENLMAKFDKKVRKIPTVQVLKERAKLKIS